MKLQNSQALVDSARNSPVDSSEKVTMITSVSIHDKRLQSSLTVPSATSCRSVSLLLVAAWVAFFTLALTATSCRIGPRQGESRAHNPPRKCNFRLSAKEKAPVFTATSCREGRI